MIVQTVIHSSHSCICDNPHDGLMAQHLCLLLLVYKILILVIEMGNLQTYVCRFFCYLNIFIIAYVGNLDGDLVILVFSYNNSNWDEIWGVT